MTERPPNPSLRAFEGLRPGSAGPPDHADADRLATASLIIGGVIGSVLGLLAFAAGLVVLNTSTVAGVAPSTVVRGFFFAVSAAAATGMMLGIVALWLSHRQGAGVSGRATAGVVASALWLVGIWFGLADDGAATRGALEVERPGWMAYADLQPGDCLAELPPQPYASSGDRVYAVPCRLSHVAEVLSVRASASGETTIDGSESDRCTRQATRTELALQPDDVVIALEPTADSIERLGLTAVACVVSHDVARTGSVVPTVEVTTTPVG